MSLESQVDKKIKRVYVIMAMANPGGQIWQRQCSETFASDNP
jgi:hypothetical protein